jgi:hypothetical protein
MATTIDPLTLKKVQDLLAKLPPDTQAAATVIIPLVWELGESTFDGWFNSLIAGPIHVEGQTFEQALADLVALDAGAAVDHADLIAKKQAMMTAVKQVLLTLLLAKLG